MIQANATKCITMGLWAAIAMTAVKASADNPRFLFGTPRPVQGITSDVADGFQTFSADGLEVFYGWSDDPDENGLILRAQRDSLEHPFGAGTPVDALNSEWEEGQLSLSADGREIYFVRRASEFESDPSELYVASRPTPQDPFGEPELLFTSPNGQDAYFAPSVSADGRSLYVQYGHFRNTNNYNSDIYVSRRESTTDSWGDFEPVRQLSSDRYEGRPSISPDDRVLFVKTFQDSSNRDADNRTGDLFMLVRETPDDDWSRPFSLGSVINTAEHDETFAELSFDGSTLYFNRFERLSDGGADILSWDILQSPVLPFDAVTVTGQGGKYTQDFDSLGTDSRESGTPLPAGWTFTANDVVFNNATTSAFPKEADVTYAQLYNAGHENEADRALAVDYYSRSRERGELDLRTVISDSPVSALRLEFDIEAWEVTRRNNGEAEFQVVLEADTGNGFELVADLGEFTTGRTLETRDGDSVTDGNDPAYRASFDTAAVDVDVPVGATLRTRWISTSNSRSVVFGLDNVSMQFAFAGDANVDGTFDSFDLVHVFQAGEYDDGIVGNSTWSEGDWNGDGEFDSSDFVTAFQAGHYERGPLASAQTVPEPSPLMLMAIGTIAIWRARRRR